MESESSDNLSVASEGGGELNFRAISNSAVVIAALRRVPLNEPFYACVQCTYPTMFPREVVAFLCGRERPFKPIAIVMPLFYDSTPMQNTSIMNIEEIHWKTVVKCKNCNTMLTFDHLNYNNTVISDFRYHRQCIVFNKSRLKFMQLTT